MRYFVTWREHWINCSVYKLDSKGIPMTSELQSAPKVSFLGLLIGVIVRPRQTFASITEEGGRGWVLMATIALLMTVLPILVAAPITTREIRENMATIQELQPQFGAMPPGANEQALQIATSPLTTTLFPAVGAIVGLIAGWLIWAGAIHLGGVMMGGQNSFPRLFHVVVWSWLPFSLRGLLQTIVIGITGELIRNPGLSGFVTQDRSLSEVIAAPPGTGRLILQSFLGRIDIFLVWNLVLLSIGVMVVARFSRKKAVLLTLGAWVILTGLSLIPVAISGVLASSFAP